MTKAWLLVATLALTMLAGCTESDKAPHASAPQPAFLQAPMEPFWDNATYPSSLDLSRLSQAVFDVLPVEQILVTMSDGMAMHNAVYRPDTSEPVPVFINFSPYWGNTAETQGDNFASYLIENLVPRGYAVVLSAIRGTGHSEGCFEVASDREAMDLREVVDHFAAQPWSNGNVAAGGKSYDSTTQNGMIAKFPTPNLKAIFHVSGITDMYSYTFHNGLWARTDAGLFTTTYSVGQGANEGVGGGESAVSQEKIIRTTQDATCTENPETVAVPVSTYATGAKTPYWVERDWTRFIKDSAWNGSIFFYHGFHDWNVQPSHIQPWIDNLPDQIRVRLWLHQDRENAGHLYPMRNDWNLTFLRWLDAELKGIDTGFWSEPMAQLQGSDRVWRAMDAWPAPRVAVDLGKQGAPPGNIMVQVSADNSYTVRLDRENLGVEGAYRLAGSITADFTATSAIADPTLSMLVLVDGEWVGEADLRGIFRESLDAPSPVVPGLPTTYRLETYPLDVVVPAGSALTLVFGGDPRHTITTPAHLTAVTYDETSIKVGVPLASLAPTLWQPNPTPCFAC